MMNKAIPNREEYFEFYPITTRWMDNDVFGHVNNVVYYSYYDTVINRFLAEHCGLNLQTSDVAAYIVHSECIYHSSISYPDDIEGGFVVNKVGNSSVEYGVSVFKTGSNSASAHGSMTHVFVDKRSGKPVPIPENIRAVFLNAARSKKQ